MPTLYDKLWQSHVVTDYGDGSALLYIDRQLLHEVSSPQAFAGLHERGLKAARPEVQLAVADHAVPTRDRTATQGAIADPQSLVLHRKVKAYQARHPAATYIAALAAVQSGQA